MKTARFRRQSSLDYGFGLSQDQNLIQKSQPEYKYFESQEYKTDRYFPAVSKTTRNLFEIRKFNDKLRKTTYNCHNYRKKPKLIKKN